SGNAYPSRATGGPDSPIPSVEDDGSRTEETSSPTPSISVSTPGASSISGFRIPNPRLPNSSSPHAGQGDVASIDDGLRELRLRSSTSPSSSAGLSLRTLRAALPSTRTPSPSQSPLLLPHRASPRSSGAPGHRRSSSAHQIPYDVRQEAPPEDRFHAPEFQQSLTQAKSLMGRLAGVLGSSRLHLAPDSVMRTLRHRADELARFRCPPTRTVGLVGDSGVGKSSLLNSLLDFRNLARASNGGAACTCVVTEYRHHDRPDFAIDVVLFTEAELREQFRTLVHAYRHNHFHSADMESEDDRKHWVDQAKLAEDTFKAMFADRFSTASLLEDSANERIVETLLNLAVQLRSRHNIGEHAVSNSPEECSDLLMNLTSERAAAQGPVAWPYIKKISVFLDAYILSKGLVLVDLPGLRDLNTARRSITERYLLECDEIFTICPIGRAATDEGVMQVFDLARQAKLSNVSIICTRSDDIRADEAQRDWAGSRAREVQTRIHALKTVEQELAGIRERLGELMELDDDLEEDEEEKVHLCGALVQKGGEVQKRKFELQRYMITTRNALVESKLHDLYRNKIQGGDLHVFCASNSLYWAKRDLKSGEQASPFLELSGIIAVRRHCMALVSDSQFRVATKYLQDDIPSLLSSIELWVESGSGTADAERKRAVREAVDGFENSLRRRLVGNASPLDDLAQVLTDAFSERVYQRRQIREWSQGAVRAGGIWAGRCSATYAAFCRQCGTHITDAVGYHCWNEEAMETMNSDLADPWDRLQGEIHGQIQNATVLILQASGRALSRYIDNASGELPDSTRRPLRTALTSARRTLAGNLEALSEKFEADLSKLRTDALSGLRTSYFGQSLESSYWSANCESGRGSWARKKAIINRALSNEKLFTDLMRKFKHKFNDLAAQLETDALVLVEAHLGVIEGTLNMVRSENIALESERDPEFRARVAGEVEGVKEAMENVWVTVSHA
ncbi:hypothetical protein C8A01DRAFT_14819, partial [Parachaetomium inaequale]